MKRIYTVSTIIFLSLASAVFADDEQQEQARAARTLKRLEQHIQKQNSQILIQMFYTDINADIVNPVGSMYYVMRDGNILIKEELAKRIVNDRKVIEEHSRDKQVLFTGYNGKHETVGFVCKKLLENSSTESNKASEATSPKRAAPQD